MIPPVFGRRSQPAHQPEPTPPPDRNDPALRGHHAVLAHLRHIEDQEPLARQQLAGRVLFDLVCKIIVEKDCRVRIEDLLAILASNGGHSCLLAALNDPSLKDPAPWTQIKISVVTTKVGNYYFGDLPNSYLLESKSALLNLALGAAQSCGAEISLDMVHQTMEHVVSTIGNENFGVPQLPDQHRPGDLPFNYVRFLWPKFLATLKLYEVQPMQWPTTLGFALCHAIMAGKDAIDPTMSARITIECAVPMAKVDPKRFAGDPN